MANTNVTIRIDDELKAQADELFDDLGMSFTTAVNIFVRQAVRENRIPFEVTRAGHVSLTYDSSAGPTGTAVPEDGR